LFNIRGWENFILDYQYFIVFKELEEKNELYSMEFVSRSNKYTELKDQSVSGELIVSALNKMGF
jgi:hypothetical protein